MNPKMRKLLKNNAFQSILSSLLCIIIGLIIGFIVLLCINPSGAFEGIMDLIKNFLTIRMPESHSNTLAAL